MTIIFSFDNDYRTWDGAETVSHVSKRNSADLQQDSLTALRLPVTSREAANSGGVYTTRDVVFLIPGHLMSYVPKEKDRVVTGGVTWVVMDWSHSPLDHTYRLTCRNLRIAADLSNTVTVYRPTFTADAAGSAIPTYSAVYSDLACRIQEISGQALGERGKMTTERRYTIFFESTITVKAEDQIREGAVVYQVVDYADPDMIHALQGVNVVKKL